jgi:putative copper resistance protein D
MAELVDLYGFLAVLLRGINLSLEAMTVGGVIFMLLCLTPRESPIERQCRKFLCYCSSLLAGGAVCSATLAALVLLASTRDMSWLDLLDTTFARSAFLIAAPAVAIAIFATRKPGGWLSIPAGVLIAGSLLTSHAFARIDDRVSLLSVTALHHLSTAAWIGGLPYLPIALTRSNQDEPVPDQDKGMIIVRRFSRLAMISVALLLGAGLLMAWQYVGSAAAIYGTAYGVMLVAKATLLGLLLLLGGSNFLLRRRAATALISWLQMRRSVEVELAIGICAILTAASLTSQPPAIDMVQGRLKTGDIVTRFTPTWPRLKTPPLNALAPATPLNVEESKRFGTPLAYVPGASYATNGPADVEWSEYNHNWAGLCVLGMGIMALLAQRKEQRWAHHWPLGFFGFALFLLIRADSENWPLGPRGFWESLQVAEVTQHRTFVVLIVLFALFQWQVEQQRHSRKWHALVFPAVCMAGGALLLTHMHPLGNLKEELLAEISHTSIALLAVMAAGARWLELRLPRRVPALGFTWAACFMMIGLVLAFYRES